MAINVTKDEIRGLAAALGVGAALALILSIPTPHPYKKIEGPAPAPKDAIVLTVSDAPGAKTSADGLLDSAGLGDATAIEPDLDETNLIYRIDASSLPGPEKDTLRNSLNDIPGVWVHALP